MSQSYYLSPLASGGSYKLLDSNSDVDQTQIFNSRSSLLVIQDVERPLFSRRSSVAISRLIMSLPFSKTIVLSSRMKPAISLLSIFGILLVKRITRDYVV